MQLGNGSIIYKGINSPVLPPGPPFDPTSADNGLSVDPVTGRIVLGDNGSGLANFLDPRQIDMQGFTFLLLSNGNGNLSINPAGSWEIGDFNSALQGSHISINDFGQAISFFANSLFEFRDPAGGNTWLTIQPNSSINIGDISTTASGSQLFVNAAGTSLLYSDTLGAYLDLQPGSTQNNYVFGDQGNIFNGNVFNIDDFNEVTTIRRGGITGPKFLELDITNNLFQFGDINGFNNQNFIRLDNTVNQFDVLIGNQVRFRVDTANGISTADPGGGSGEWKLGKVTAGAIVVDAANYVETMIDGVIVKLIKAA